ncbi:MAG: TlpA disulfide reductase family protein [Dehalococcoidia bacterium]
MALAVGLIGALTVACSPGNGASPAAGGAEGSTTGETDLIVAYQGREELGGDEVAFDSLLGTGKPVVLNFWAAQCPPCRVEMPWFQAAYDRHAGDVLLVGVDIGPFVGLGSHEQARALLADLAITYPTARAVDERLLRRYDLLAMPTTVFFAGDGSVWRSHSGLLTERQIADAFAELAESNP